MRLVDLDELLKFPIRMDHYDKKNGNKHFVYGIETVLEYAEYLPIVEMVQCKECKHWSDGVSGCTDYVKCCKIGFYMVGANGYCVYGERKTDDES